MKSNIKNVTQTFTEVPQTFEVDGIRTDNYNLRTDSHYADGWREVLEPVLEENEILGGLYFDIENDVITYLVLKKSPEELEAERTSKIPNEITPRQFKLALALSGITPEEVETFINTLPMPDNVLAMINWRDAKSFKRNNEMIVSFAPQIGLTETQLDDLFVLGSTFE